jgi:hypothetical protein
MGTFKNPIFVVKRRCSRKNYLIYQSHTASNFVFRALLDLENGIFRGSLMGSINGIKRGAIVALINRAQYRHALAPECALLVEGVLLLAGTGVGE